MRITGIKEVTKESKKLQYGIRSRLQIQIDKKGKLYCYKCYSNDYFKNDSFVTIGYIYNKITMQELKIWIMEKIKECIYSDHVYNDYMEKIPLEKMHF